MSPDYLIPLDLIRTLATVDETDSCHYWFLRDKLVAPYHRQQFDCRYIDMAQYDDAGRKLLNWLEQGYFWESEGGIFHLTFKGLWTLHAGLGLYGESVFVNYY